jgi:hypothetical protein
MEEKACTEQFELIVEDLAECLKADSRPLIYDGYVSPHILVALLPNKTHAYYLVASEQFQRNFYKERPWAKDVLAKTSNPEQAWDNWMQRDSLGARSLESDLRRTGLNWMLVAGAVSLEATVDLIATQFARAHQSDFGV